ncbi:hydroxyethylthiazole kinase [Anaerotignum neopropionicum]|uniref:Hydroxyethylthiazole kinase n=1 Tax=Anaerotignum neopropionicum TaxID=36847 RepID=A0A136WI48_9FIRM|nr:hydroxyethylthiazole kinase [Anaerotignum neopropionicum]KXL54029.1 hydroxyethylthiazole kinase [Anaerotignum neopropionicum]
MEKKLIENVRQSVPLVHNITNYVTVNDVANILLACGGSPIMADDAEEAEEITSICGGLNINIGTLNARTIESMLLAGKRANELGHIIVLDPVGAGASRLRTETAMQLLEKVRFSVIRGNVSELKTLWGGSGSTKGVDADLADRVTEGNLDEMVEFAKKLSKKTGAVIAMTGAIDIVTDESKAYAIRNGNPLMSKITGTGCMLSGVVAAYCVANPDHLLDATAAAVAAMGLSGEIAFERLEKTALGGTSSYRTYIIDAMSNMSDEILKEGMKLEAR